tara:strand:- start:228 stop:560 length:333 start_codon:yes stop_codon:yes gene_type:complete
VLPSRRLGGKAKLEEPASGAETVRVSAAIHTSGFAVFGTLRLRLQQQERVNCVGAGISSCACEKQPHWIAHADGPANTPAGKSRSAMAKTTASRENMTFGFYPRNEIIGP